MQLVAGATGLCKRGPALREIGILHGRRLECHPPLLEVGLPVGGRGPDRAPDLGGEAVDCLLLNRGIVDEPLEHRRQPVVAGTDKRLQGLTTLVAVGVAVGEQSPQLRHDPWIAKSHRRQIGQPADRVVGVGAELLVALLPGPRRRHPAAGGQRRHDLLEHPLPHVRVAGRQLRDERLVAGLFRGGAADDEPRHRGDAARGGDRERAGRIERHERLDGIPVHQWEVVVVGVFRMGDECRGDRPAGRGRQPLEG